jgi:hypothetical protein
MVGAMSTELHVSFPLSALERIKAASSLEEIKTMVMELESSGAFDPYSVLPYDPDDPNSYYKWLRQKDNFHPELAGKGITLYKAFQEYNISFGALAHWMEKGVIRVIEKAPKPGAASKINERDVAIVSEMNRKFRTENGTKKGGAIKGWRPEPLREDED